MNLEERIKKLEEEVNILKREKCNTRPFIWINNRVGQIERRIDHLGLDDWEGDLGRYVDVLENLYQKGEVGKRYATSC